MNQDELLLLQFQAEHARKRSWAEMDRKIAAPRRERADWILMQLGKCLISQDAVSEAAGDSEKAVAKEWNGRSWDQSLWPVAQSLRSVEFRARLTAIYLIVDEMLLAEREACAKIADEEPEECWDCGCVQSHAGHIARDIRARSQKSAADPPLEPLGT